MSSFPGSGMTFDILGGMGNLDRTLRDAEQRIKGFAADVGRIKADVSVGVRSEANDLFNNRRFPSSGKPSAPAGSPPPGGGPAGAAALGSFTRGIGAAAASVAVIEGGIQAAAIAVKALGAAADAANGDTKTAVKKLADLGDAVTEMHGPLGFIAREARDLIGLVTGHTQATNKALADAAKNDQKTAVMSQRNTLAREANARFKDVAEGEADRLAKENATPSESALVDLRRRIKEEQKFIENSKVRGVDQDAASKALAAMKRHEIALASDAARERETLENQHQSHLTAIVNKGLADRLRAEGFTDAAARAELEERHRAEDREQLTALQKSSVPELQRRAFDALGVGREAREQELAAFDAEVERKQAEARKKSAEESSNFASAAGEAGLKREQERDAVAKDTREAQFEARQATLKSRGLDQRADLEAIQQRAAEDLRTAEDPKLRSAIEGREASELRAVLKQVEGRRQTGEVVSDPTRTAFGRGGRGVDTNNSWKEVDNTLKGDILKALREISTNTAAGQVAKTS